MLGCREMRGQRSLCSLNLFKAKSALWSSPDRLQGGCSSTVMHEAVAFALLHVCPQK